MSGITIERRGPVLVLLLNRPERRNAVDYEMSCAIEDNLDLFDADDDLHAAVVTGAGGYFSAGADLKAAAQGAPPAFTKKRGNFGLVRKPPEKPLLAAVEGGALGGGFEIVLACDLVVASRDAVFGLPEAGRGVLAAAGGYVRLARRIPSAIALELALTAQPASAVRLHELGLINKLCDGGNALAEACAMAEIIARNAPLAVQAAKRIVNGATEMSEAESWAAQKLELEKIRATVDYREGIRAFAEKRSPLWRGK
jgi:enoyl-CoA hydratase/carnithine racemase